MVFRRQLFRKVAVLGTGLIGGSMALALKKGNWVSEVVGYSRQEASLKVAKDMGAIDEGVTDVRKAVYRADLVILAAPVNVIVDHIEQIARNIKHGCVVTDVGSSKSLIVEAAHKHFPPQVLFVGSHPMAGSEKSGMAYARADLFSGATCIMTPTEKTNRLAKDKVKHLWTTLGAQVHMMGPNEHDETLAYVSHLPHLMAFGLMRAIPDDFIPHGSSGLKDTTRIAASSPKMWSDICLSNYRNVLKAIDEGVRSLAEIRKAVVDKDGAALEALLQQANVKREILDKKS